MAQSILYYPSINIEDSEWLRSALLYWDEINSIVPYKDYCELSSELLYLENIGQYRSIYPSDVFSSNNTNDFIAAVERHFNHNFTKLYDENKNLELLDVLLSPDVETLIHYNKIPRDVLNFFNNRGVIKDGNNDWVSMNKEFAFHYMRLLADFVATTSLEDTVIGTRYIKNVNEIYQRSYTNNRLSAVSILLEKCLPIPTMDVGFEDLINFKERHKSELLQIRFQIRELENNIVESTNIRQLKFAMADFRERWEYELEQSQKMFNGRNIKFTLGSLRSFVTDAGVVAGLSQWATDNQFLNIPQTAVGTAVGMSGLLGVGAYFLKYRDQVKAMKKNNGFAYVLSAKKAGLLKSRKNIDIV